MTNKIMNKLTDEFLNQLKDNITRDELVEVIINEQQKIKVQLFDIGLKFYPSDNQFSEDIVGGQNIVGDELIYKAHHYEDLNYLRQGLVKEWHSHLDKMERYNLLREKIKKLGHA